MGVSNLYKEILDFDQKSVNNIGKNGKTRLIWPTSTECKQIILNNKHDNSCYQS